ncbi:hypothetical protein [Kocuria rosea]|uniref:hypothetical protein n=1 Tax=Kocuria rosea TaxID=1275 RepID=UPI0020413083|nr:hypothetical protein [Kocuria rosea]MCM3689477.1 hypothetical protein [Kocuria rosea]
MTGVSRPGTDPEDPRESSPKPLKDEIAESRPRRGGRINPAKFEVRLRRWALLLLVAVPAIWFLAQRLQ